MYNDFDNFKERLNNIKNTNAILSELRVLLEDYPREKKIVGEKRTQVLNILKQHNKIGFVDWITLSSSLLFSMDYGVSLAKFKKKTLYNKIRKSNYPLALDYLQGVEIVSMDYKDLFDKYKNTKEVVFIIDPPYLSSDASTYSNTNYWQIKDYLDVLKVLNGQNYFYFTSNKSQIVELCEWLDNNIFIGNPFENAEKTSISTSPSGNASYTDIMYHYKK